MKFSSWSVSLLCAPVMLSSNSNRIFANAYLRGINGTVHQENATQVLQEDLVGMFIIVEDGMDNADGDRQLQKNKPGHRNRTSAIQLPDGTFYTVTNARANWEDRLQPGRDMIRIPRGYAKSWDGTIDMRGMEPSVVPELFDRNLQEDYPITDPTPDQGRNLAAFQSGRKLQTTGTRTVLAVHVILNDGSYNFASQTGLSNDIFGNGVDSVSLKSQFAVCSYNKLIFNKAPNRGMSSNVGDGSTGINNGVVDIRVNLNRSAGETNIVNAVSTKINSVFGVSNPNVLANHVMYCLPSGIPGQAIGMAQVPGGLSWYNNGWCNMVSTQMHEIGHNLNFGHSNENGIEYDNQTGVMGFGIERDDEAFCFNGAMSWQMGWYASKSRVVEPSAGGCFEGNVHGISDFGNAASSTVILKINDLSSTDYYVAFNRQSGINSGTREYGNQVTVTRHGAEGTRYSDTELVAKLGAGGRWSGAISGKNMIINVLSIDLASSPAFARVRISENGGSCGPTSGSSKPTTRRPTSKPTTRRPTSKPTTAPPMLNAPLPTYYPTWF